MPLRINCPSPLRLSAADTPVAWLTLPESCREPPLDMLTAKLPASTIGAEIVWVPLTTVIEAPADVPKVKHAGTFRD